MAKLSYQDIGDWQVADVANIGKTIVLPTKEALRQLRFALTGNLTIRDNAYAAIVTLGYQGNSTQTLTSGVEYNFQNPLKTKPIGFTPINAVDANGISLNIDGFDFNTARTDGLLGVTPWMFSSTGYVGEKISSSIGTAAAISFPFSGTTIVVTSITINQGTYEVSYGCGAGNAVTGTRFQAGINSSITIPSSTLEDNTWGDTPTMPTASSNISLALSGITQSPNISTSLNLVARMLFSAGTPIAWGRISAVRSSLFNNGITGLMTGILWGG